jgi:hypothetical protein
MSQQHLEPVEEATEHQEHAEDNNSGDSGGDDGESDLGSEYPENDIRMLADALITSNGEVIADVMAGIRDAIEKLNKILYNKLGK